MKISGKNVGKQIIGRIGTVVWVIVVCFILVLYGMWLVPLYDKNDAEASLGKTYDFSEGWRWVKTDGEIKEVAFPYSFPEDESSAIVLTNKAPAEYGGLSMTIPVKNAAIRAFAAGKPIYEAGYEEVDSSDDEDEDIRDELNQEQENDSSDALDPEDGGGPLDGSGEDIRTRRIIQNRNRNTIKIGSEDNVIDLPDSDKEFYVKVILEKVDAEEAITVEPVTVAKRDVALLTMLRGNLVPLLDILLILISISVLVSLELMRLFNGKGLHGLFRLALFGVVEMLFCGVRTMILTMFMGNKEFFMEVEIVGLILGPLLFVHYFEKRFAYHFPKRTYALVWFTTIGAFALGCGVWTKSVGLNQIMVMNIASFALIIIVMIYSLFEWRRRYRLERDVRPEVFSLLLLLASSVLIPIQEIMGVEDSNLKNIPMMTLMAAFFTITVINEINVMYQEYKWDADEAARQLQRQVDATEEKNRQLGIAMDEAESAKQDAILANEAKSRFLANMSHEIRTPINAVLGMDEMILRESREKGIRGYAMDIYTAGQTLLSLINDILDFSKIESGKMEIVPVDYDMSSLINDLVNMTNQRAKAKDLIFSVEVDPGIPARVYGDDVRIRQVLTNILTNAVKYTREGNVWMRVSCHEAEDSPEEVVMHFEVSDSGIGIKAEDLPKLFKAYERIEESRNRNIEGTGLGMNITLQLLALMGSKLEVESVYGEGSTFWFDIRQKVMDPTPLGDFQSRIEKLSEDFTYTNGFTAPEAKVLVVDDNSMNRKVFVSLLKPTELQVDEAESGYVCLDLCADKKYDIIFMDHMMPGMDGVETFHKLRGDGGLNADTPCFILTANAVTGAREQYLAEGFDGFLSKPVVSEKLESAILDTLPQEYIKPGRDDISMDDEPASSALPEDLPMVDGLDWNIAWLHLPEREILESSVREYYDLIRIHGKKLESFYESIGTPEGMNEYRIQVHGMKSSAATIGIFSLAGLARILEFAARDEDIQTILKLHDIFMREWYGMEEKLQGVFGIGSSDSDDSDKEQADPGMIKAMLSMLSAAMEDLDIDTADEQIEMLSSFSLPPEISEKLPELKGAVADLDSDLAQEIIEELL